MRAILTSNRIGKPREGFLERKPPLGHSPQELLLFALPQILFPEGSGEPAFSKKAGSPHKQKLGFSLLEILVVVTIVGLLSMLIFWSYHGCIHHCTDTLEKNLVRQLNDRLMEYRLLCTANRSDLPSFRDREEAINTLRQAVPGHFAVLDTTGIHENALALVSFDQEAQRFFLNKPRK